MSRVAFSIFSVSGVAPVNTVAPVASGTRGVGLALSCTTGTWTGSPTPTYSYQWQRGATLDGGGAWSDIGGATASAYNEVAADCGYSIRCVVTATGYGSPVTASSNTLAPWTIQTMAPDLHLRPSGVTGSPVSAWANDGASGGSFTAAGGARPTLTTIDGYACPTFDGSANTMTSTKLASDCVSSTAYSWIGVVQFNALTGTPGSNVYDLPAPFTDANGVTGPLVGQSDGVRAGHYKTASQYAGAVVGISTGVPYYTEHTYANTGSNVGTLVHKINGTTRTNNASTDLSSTLTGTLRLGGNYNYAAKFSGVICELAGLKRTITSQEKLNAAAYLENKFPTSV